MDNNEKPLVTFALFAYNQEDYIREAIEGAFSQIYEPLEIILSDDCSPDRTFEIMQEVASSYAGPHTIKIRRNDSNLGLLGHINLAAKEFSGDFVVLAAGDDISKKERVARILDVFKLEEDFAAVYTNFEALELLEKQNDSTAEKVKSVSLFEIVLNGGGVGKGATYAYKRECFFWPALLPDNLYSEDRILPLRAIILGGVAYLPENLVLYREGPSGMGRVLRFSGRLPYKLPSHIKNLHKELNEGLQQGRIGLVDFYLCIVALYTRFILSKKSKSRLLNFARVRSAFSRCVLFLLKKIIPKDNYISLK